MTRPDGWEGLRETWRPAARPDADAAGAAETASLIAQAARTRRVVRLVAAAELVIVAVAIIGVGAALRHAANLVELLLGLSVALAITSAWVLHVVGRRREDASAGASASEYLLALRGLRRRQLRFVHFAWLVVALELVFLVTWWAGGIPEHPAQLSAPIAIVSLWIPLVVIGSFVAWTTRLRRTASADLQRLTRLERELHDG